MMENASVALLMLDIASAKSTLSQLQQTFTAADAEHQRTKNQLQHLKDQKQVIRDIEAKLMHKVT
jgi:predicted transcriptional regulator